MSERMGGGVSVVGLSDQPVGWLVWRRPSTAPVLTVVCRATFILRPGEAVLADDREPLSAVEQPYPDGTSSGLYAPADLVPMKPRADVVLVGRAFAPAGHPGRSFVVRLAVGEVDKRVKVFSDRQSDLHGLGPIAGSSPARRALLGPNLGTQPPPSWHEQIVPAELDPAYFQVAPGDQQLQVLHDDERIVLENLHPQHNRLVTRLPGIRPRAFVEGRGASPGVAMRADTLWINTSSAICMVTWRGQLRLEDAAHPVRVLVAMEEPGRPLGWQDIERLRDAAVADVNETGGAPVDVTTTLAAPLDAALGRSAALPFVSAPRPQEPREPAGYGGLPFHAPGAPPPQPMPSRSLMTPQVQPPSVPAEEIVDTAPPSSEPVTAPVPPVFVQPVAGPPPGPAVPLPIPAPVVPIVAKPLGAAPPAAPLIITAPVQSAERSPPVTPAPRVSAPSPLNLVWFDPQCLPRLRKDPRFAPILRALDEQPLDEDLDDPAHAEDTADIEDRREAFEILARGALSAEAVTATLAGAACDDGRLLQPIVLLAGDLALAFDELEALKATMSAATPLAGSDPEARGILDLTKEFLGTPGLPGAPDVADGLGTRIRETFEKRGLASPGQLDALAERALLGGRLFQRRLVFGGPHVSARFHVGRTEAPIPVYLCEELTARLPAAARMRVRLLAHVHPAVEQYETHPAALRAAALAIVGAPLTTRR